MKGNAKTVTSKDIIESLTRAKDDHMKNFFDNSSSCFISDYINEDSDESRLAYLQRRMHPERQALTAEELEVLVENDIISKQYEVKRSGPSVILPVEPIQTTDSLKDPSVDDIE